MTVAIVNFRTLANGSYKYMRGLRRGYWRLLIVRDAAGPTAVHSHNVVRIAAEGAEGILGVTEKSAYYIDGDRERLEQMAARINAQTVAAGLAQAYAPQI